MNNWWIGTRTQYTRHPPVHSWSLNKSLKEAGRQDTGRRSSMWTSSETAWLFHSHGITERRALLTLAWSNGWSISMDTTQERVFFLEKTTDLCTATVLEIHLIKPTKSTEKPTRCMWLPTCVWAAGSRMSTQTRASPALCLNAAGNPHTEAVLVGQQGRTPHHHLTERVLITKNKAFVL